VTLLDLLTDHPFGDDEALVHTVDRALTKAEVIDRVTVLGRRLTRETPEACAVAVVGDGLDALVGMFACWQAERVFVPINPRQPASAIDDAVERSNAPATVVGDVIEAVAPSPPTELPPDTAMMLWTSGTTGKPKQVLHTHIAYRELIDRVLAPLTDTPNTAQRRPPSPNLIPVSLALNAGIYNALFGLRAGAPLVLMDRFSTAEFMTLVRRHEIRSTVLPPAAIAMLNDDVTIDSLAPLRYVRSITAPLSPFQATRFTARFDAFVLNSYGQAEIGEVIGWTAADARAHPDKIGAAGRPHAGVEVTIDQPDANDVGQLLVRPPNYAVDLTPDRLTNDGFIRTGDLARVDPEGFVWIEGRLSDLINRGGNKVFPNEVEEVLAAVTGVTEVSVVGRPDDRLGQVPVAVIVGNAPDEALESAARAQLVAYKVPVEFVRRAELPRSEAGKVLRRQLVEELT
jgi:long-chain acyl-CoA synthetase